MSTNRIAGTGIHAKRDLIRQAAAAARTAATPVFADISRFAEPSSTRMVWMPTTTGHHPSFV